ncbi:MAG: class I SAM-dependent methyltransferase, partial [bacterium]
MRRETYVVEREVAESHWWFQGRRRILERLLEALPLPRGARVLDAGCGTGANAPVLARHGEVVGVDASRVALELRGRDPVVLARLEELPFGSQRFD